MGKDGDLVRTSTQHDNNRGFRQMARVSRAGRNLCGPLARPDGQRLRRDIRLRPQGITAISDACYANSRITEAGGPVTLQFDGQGFNDGPFGSFPATGKRVSFLISNVIAVNDDGQIARMEQLYDRLDIPIKLGHMPPD